MHHYPNAENLTTTSLPKPVIPRRHPNHIDAMHLQHNHSLHLYPTHLVYCRINIIPTLNVKLACFPINRMSQDQLHPPRVP